MDYRLNASGSEESALFSRLTITLYTARRLIVSVDWADSGKTVQTDPFSRLYYTFSGQGTLWFTDGPVEIHPRCVYSIPAFTPCRYVCSKDMDLCYIHYNAAFPGGIDLYGTYDFPRKVIPRHQSLVEALFIALTETGADDAERDGFIDKGVTAPSPPERLLLRESGIKVILSELTAFRQRKKPGRPGGSSRFEPFFTFVEENLQRDLTLSQMAATVALHPTYFSNLFTRTMGLSPTAYLRRKRIDRAAILLAFQDDTLETIARITGFCDAFHLSKVFKELTGQSPRTFRDRVRNAGG